MRTRGLVTFEAATMYVCASSYRRSARERLAAGIGGGAAGDVQGAAAPNGGALIAEFSQSPPARRLRRLLDPEADGEVWVRSDGYGVRRQLGRHQVLTTHDRQARMLADLQETWRSGVAVVHEDHPARVQRATELWRGLLAAAAPVRGASGLCLPLPAGPLAEIAVNGAGHLGISARVRRTTTQFCVVSVDSHVHVLRLMQLMRQSTGHAPADLRGTT
ncbi:hypothetical protein O7632_13250 [Solwaraspora sp. WMMD406]|uniref:hypothetical protein n=1 Tax=Solwaraspora sp. WMMD406 TaxID=3016095 RepID=UPI002417377C|nr:hypothetical protein [Solwaraspora sp. WMMD406]MDG4765057.1 hypothetical protein [Solwaraspora sp. WMMD406]